MSDKLAKKLLGALLREMPPKFVSEQEPEYVDEYLKAIAMADALGMTVSDFPREPFLEFLGNYLIAQGDGIARAVAASPEWVEGYNTALRQVREAGAIYFDPLVNLSEED